jgi:hypothetical protein
MKFSRRPGKIGIMSALLGFCQAPGSSPFSCWGAFSPSLTHVFDWLADSATREKFWRKQSRNASQQIINNIVLLDVHNSDHVRKEEMCQTMYRGLRSRLSILRGMIHLSGSCMTLYCCLSIDSMWCSDSSPIARIHLLHSQHLNPHRFTYF